jgi:hypothetical protein
VCFNGVGKNFRWRQNFPQARRDLADNSRGLTNEFGKAAPTPGSISNIFENVSCTATSRLQRNQPPPERAEPLN